MIKELKASGESYVDRCGIDRAALAELAPLLLDGCVRALSVISYTGGDSEGWLRRVQEQLEAIIAHAESMKGGGRAES